MSEEEKVYTSYEEYEKDVFPKRYKERKKQEKIDRMGLGKYVAEKFLKAIRKELGVEDQ